MVPGDNDDDATGKPVACVEDLFLEVGGVSLRLSIVDCLPSLLTLAHSGSMKQ